MEHSFNLVNNYYQEDIHEKNTGTWNRLSKMQETV
jgi:hypothetical protein